MNFIILYLVLMSLSAILFGVLAAVTGNRCFERETLGFDLLFIFVLPFIGIGFSLAHLSDAMVKRHMQPTATTSHVAGKTPSGGEVTAF
jgi:hypothetical protein